MLILYKVAEPLLYYQLFLHSQDAAEAWSPNMDVDGCINMNIPFSLPYTSFYHSEDTNPELIEKDGKFYNIVERHYANDTLSVKLKPNESARERFDAFSELVNQVVQHKSDAPGNTGAKKVASYDDWLKNVTLSKKIIPTQYQSASDLMCFWQYNARFAVCYLSIPSPPPELT